MWMKPAHDKLLSDFGEKEYLCSSYLLLHYKPIQKTLAWNNSTHLFCSWICDLGRAWWQWLISAPCNISWDGPAGGWWILFQDHNLVTSQWIMASAGAVSQDFGFFQCGPLLGFLSARHLDYKRNIPRDRRWELPISSDLDSEAGTVCLPFYSIVWVVTEPT